MALTSYEEAHLCPKCEKPGTLLNKRRSTSRMASPGTMIEMLECHNDRCPDFVPPTTVGTSTVVPGIRMRWSVQINADGTIPPKGSGATGPKAFDTVGPHTGAAQRARDQLAYLAANDERKAGEAYEIERSGGVF